MSSPSFRPVVLVHGLWNNPRIFCRLVRKLEDYGLRIFVPELKHFSGRVSLRVLAKDLDRQILDKFGYIEEINLLGFSMGGVISRIWIQ